MRKVAVIGLGYVGLEIALAASKNNIVVGYDLDESKINKLKSGISYIEGISETVLTSALQSKRFLPTTNQKDIQECTIIVICVPTPLDINKNPDISFIEKACDVIVENLKNSALIINESTSHPGTLREIIFQNISKRSKYSHLYASSPERVDPGNVKWTLENTPRLISGLDEKSIQEAKDFYSSFAKSISIVSTPEVAETAKLFENTFRQVNIALVNELAIICGKLGIDVYEVLAAASTKPYGFMQFRPGHCIPVDPTYLAHTAEKVGASAEFIRLANKVNSEMPERIVEKCAELTDGLYDKEVLIVGVSYKPGIADTRETPAKVILEYCNNLGARVSWWDPLVDEWFPGKIDKIDSKKFDLTIIQVLHKKEYIKELLDLNTLIFDCTGEITNARHL